MIVKQTICVLCALGFLYGLSSVAEERRAPPGSPGAGAKAPPPPPDTSPGAHPPPFPGSTKKHSEKIAKELACAVQCHNRYKRCIANFIIHLTVAKAGCGGSYICFDVKKGYCIPDQMCKKSHADCCKVKTACRATCKGEAPPKIFLPC